MVKEIFLFFKYKVKQTLRNPIFIFMNLSTPLMYLVFFSPLIKGITSIQKFIPGLMVLLAFLGGLFVGFGIIDELRSGIIERYKVIPINRASVLLGIVLHDVIFVIISILFLILISLFYGFKINILYLIISLCLLSLLIIISSSLSYTLGLIVKSEDKLAPITHGLNMPLMLLSGMMLPMSLAPKWLKIIAYFNPIYHAVEACRNIMEGNLFHSSIFYAFSIMILISILTISWGVKVFSNVVR